MAKRKPATSRSLVYLHGTEGEAVVISEMLPNGEVRSANQLTPEELEFVQKRIRYNAVQGHIEYYAKRGYKLTPLEDYLITPAEPVGRFAE